MEEKNQTICKTCREIKPRIADGKFDGKNKRWRDDHGKLWNGRLCPKCTVEQVKSQQQKKRDAKKVSTEST